MNPEYKVGDRFRVKYSRTFHGHAGRRPEKSRPQRKEERFYKGDILEYVAHYGAHYFYLYSAKHDMTMPFSYIDDKVLELVAIDSAKIWREILNEAN